MSQDIKRFNNKIHTLATILFALTFVSIICAALVMVLQQQSSKAVAGFVLCFVLLGSLVVSFKLFSTQIFTTSFSDQPSKKEPSFSLPEQKESKENPLASTQSTASGALLLLSLLQEKGRFVDFLMQDIVKYSNEQAGAAARIVHGGCRDILIQCFDPKPVSPVGENQLINLEENYQKTEYKLFGSIPPEPPFRGKIVHKGWKANHIKLPQTIQQIDITKDPVIVPAEVEFKDNV